MDGKYAALCDLLRAYPRAAIAFSGGADSGLLLHAAASAGVFPRAYYVKSAFQPAWEQRDAARFAQESGVPLQILELDLLADPEIVQNDAQRCYHCKRRLFSAILDRARADGCPVLLDGTNASDDAADRPGMRALSELSVLSPLRLCGIDKAAVRRLSRERGLPSADKPAYACLATRIPTGTAISASALARVEAAEDALFDAGFQDFRVRLTDGGALLQFREEDQARFLRQKAALLPLLQRWFPAIEMDPTARKGG